MQEDDLLREQISIHGTEKEAVQEKVDMQLNFVLLFLDVLALFKLTARVRYCCRWYTYLNSECKKGGWTPEEDVLLCEAQRIFGNRWTEIAKVVSGRTDNAVKNRFSTLCKKRAKEEALSKENNSIYITPNNNRIGFQDGWMENRMPESTERLKKIRTHTLHFAENCNIKAALFGGSVTDKQQPRPPLAELIQNFNNASNLTGQHRTMNTNLASNSECHTNIPLLHNLKTVTNSKDRETFLRRDDPKINALIQQAGLLSSLALRVNSENNNGSIDNAWKELQDFLMRSEESEVMRSRIAEMDFLLDDFRDLVEDLKHAKMGNQLSWRQPDLHEESQGSSEYSTGSTHQLCASTDKTEKQESSQNHTSNAETCLSQTIGCRIHSGCEDRPSAGKTIDQGSILPSCDKPKDGVPSPLPNTEFSSCDKPKDGVPSPLPNTVFSSPTQMIPPFAEGIPSPKFSESSWNKEAKRIARAKLTLHDIVGFLRSKPPKQNMTSVMLAASTTLQTMSAT
ncbi:SANT SWI3, ADA2, N-CoR and TFIIIB'' DNA-binding domain [Asimina triloba]